MKVREYSMPLGGKTLSATFSDLAEQANGSVLVQYGDTTVLATVVMSKDAKEGKGYFPLSVEYEERFYASGEILGSRFMRREGRPSDEAVLSGRAIDRTIRPLFNKRMRHDVQVVITVLSLGEDDPDVLAINAASLALATSDIPWNGPVSAVRIGEYRTSKPSRPFIVNPTREQLSFDLLVCGRHGNVSMIEMNGDEVPEARVMEGFKHAVSELENILEFQKKIIDEHGRSKRAVHLEETSTEIINAFETHITPLLQDTLFSTSGKEGIRYIEEKWGEVLREHLPDTNKTLAYEHLDQKIDEVIHTEAIRHGRRVDGRAAEELRSLYAQAGGISDVIHGTGIFYRGGTHVLSALTLGGPQDALLIDGMEIKTEKHFMHHYNFPPFSVGETGRVGGFNRRMIGHGALAEKALRAVIPEKEVFPYTIRIVSEAFSSNGSTSMASVCGSTLALMDAGVPITAPVAGIAMGLMMHDHEHYTILTDIQGPEDHHGDMDLKVAGTRAGITAIQMDVKVEGISLAILEESLSRAKDARMQILDTIEEALPEPRKELPANAPRVLVHTVHPEQIGLVIGPGGKTVSKIRNVTNAEVQIEDNGIIYIIGKNGQAEQALRMIQELTHEYTAGEMFTGTVKRVLDFGMIVEIAPNVTGLVHVSEMAPFRIENVHDHAQEGDTVPVIIKEIDDRNRISLSIKERDPEFFSSDAQHNTI